MMPNKLSKWMREKLPSNKKKKPLPVLPSPRPRVLTPSPSHQSLIASAATATANSAFFKDLPFEIRRKILLEAFGHVIVHMDLRLEHPILRRKDGADRNPPHYHQSHFGPLEETKEKLDTWKPKEWQWWSCVCHRAPPGRAGFAVKGMALTEPFEDQCRQGYDHWCEFWPGEKPGKCYIGIMGWLLSCRQAYAEAVDVIYAMNTVFMASTTLVLNLPKLLLPQRLTSITAVEMLWHVHPLRDALLNDSPDSDLSAFHSLLNGLPLTFPSLKKLYISLQGNKRCKQWAGSYDEVLQRSESVIMNPIDEMVREMGAQLEECIITLPLPLYNPRRFKARGEILDLGWRVPPDMERLWRELPKTKTGQREHLDGYWVCLGQTDSFTVAYGMPCFGSSAVTSPSQSEETKVYIDFKLRDAQDELA